ncbi:hypothetical protein [Pseudooceanicola aestuarii]|uniref:hypothetical protein n=1 Tax=Pseudooceanicola aestuarii TaxID=2697319 RepID=UPI0013D8A957|nr:hypothetical protein [Pseudooceanicola aestuarii]
MTLAICLAGLLGLILWGFLLAVSLPLHIAALASAAAICGLLLLAGVLHLRRRRRNARRIRRL